MMEKQIMELNKRYARKKLLKRIVALLCVFVMLFTVNSLKMVAQTLTRKPMCGLKEHQHKAKCYDASGNLVCGKVEHQHTDACYQESPTLEIEDDSAIGVNDDLALDEGGLSLDLDAGALDLNDDLVTEDVAAPVANEAPVTPTYVPAEQYHRKHRPQYQNQKDQGSRHRRQRRLPGGPGRDHQKG